MSLVNFVLNSELQINRNQLIFISDLDWKLKCSEQVEKQRLTAIEWIEPKRTPVLEYSTFMTTRNWFHSIGGFDDDFRSPNMVELGIRTWSCGGKVKICPCSFVLTLKSTINNQPIVYDNTNRTASLWSVLF